MRNTNAEPGPRLTVAAVAHRLGVAPATLRTWDRRYGLGPTAHESGAHRRYSPEDLGRLENMRRLIQSGVAPAEAASSVLAPGYDGTAGDARFPDRDGRLPGGSGGRVLAVPGANVVVRGLARAAMALDSDAVVTMVADQVTAHGVIRTWEHVLAPVLVSVGERWATTGEGVEIEHLLSRCVATGLRQAVNVPVGPGRPVLLACAPDDQHDLPLHALAAGLAERGQGCRILGALPAEALVAAVRRTGPAALFVWSQTQATGDVAVLTALPVTRPPTCVVVGGPGWPETLPARVSRADGLGAALTLLGQALNGQALASEA